MMISILLRINLCESIKEPVDLFHGLITSILWCARKGLNLGNPRVLCLKNC